MFETASHYQSRYPPFPMSQIGSTILHERNVLRIYELPHATSVYPIASYHEDENINHFTTYV